MSSATGAYSSPSGASPSASGAYPSGNQSVVSPAPVSVVSSAPGVVSPVSPAAALSSEHSIPTAVSICDLICRHLQKRNIRLIFGPPLPLDPNLVNDPRWSARDISPEDIRRLMDAGVHPGLLLPPGEVNDPQKVLSNVSAAAHTPWWTLRFAPWSALCPSRPSVTAAAFSLTLPGSCIQAGFPADSKSGISSSPIVTIPSELQIYSVPVIDDGAPKYLPDEATDNPHVLVVKANITTEGSSPVRIVSHARNLNDVLVLDSLTGSAIPDPLGQVEVGASPPEFPTAQSLLADLQFNLLDHRATEYLQADDNFHLHGLSFGMPLLCAF